ncbi:MAG: carbohydrate porin [Candidatus Binatia bacterium]|nr:carbohydrate porin [Candidatus Binatia bacterium]
MARTSGQEGLTRLVPRALAAVLALLAFGGVEPNTVRADINPWMVGSVFDPERWDSGGAYSATAWMHPPPNQPDMGWGMLDPGEAIETGDWQKMSGFAGSWGGARGRLQEMGIGFSSAYFGQLAANPVGGLREGGTSWRGDLAGAVFVDLERVAGWDRTFFTASASWKAGNPTLSTNYVGNELPTQLDAFGDPNAVRLVHLALSKQLFDNTTEVIVGRLISGEDFASIRLACTSLNQALCGNPIAGSRNIDFPAFPSAVWGGVVKVKPQNDWIALAGTYLVYPDFRERTDNGVNFSAPDGSGALTLGQVEYLTGRDPGAKMLRGRYFVGGYYSTERVNKWRDSSAPEVGGWYGFFAMGEQHLWSPDDSNRGVSLWTALSWAPPDRNKIQFMGAGGVLWQGIFGSRPNDGLAVLGAYASWSDRIPDTTGEVLLEANYRFTLTPWFWIEPDIQGILNPSGSSAIRDALIVGFAVGFVL